MTEPSAEARPRVLVVVVGDAPGWKPASLDCVVAQGLDAGLAQVRTTACDCVLLQLAAEPAGELERLCSTCEDLVLPVVLVADGRLAATARLLASLPFDGFIDRQWDEELAIAVLTSALRSFQAGRTVVEIQRNVLRSAKSEVDTLQHLAFHDDLTALHNLRYFREVVSKEHQRCLRHGRAYSLVFFDLDGLREVNARYGHPAGGQVLTQIGATIGSTTRTSDFAFRIGGDEFVTLLVETDKKGARTYAELVRKRIETTRLEVGEATLSLSVSAGVAAFPDDGRSPDEVLQNADKAVYRAKTLGKNRVFCHGE